MRDPIDALRDEHRIIGGMLDALETAANRVGTGGELPEIWWTEVIDWLRAFADRNHQAKEEASLFPAMIKAGVPVEDGPNAYARGPLDSSSSPGGSLPAQRGGPRPRRSTGSWARWPGPRTSTSNSTGEKPTLRDSPGSPMMRRALRAGSR